MKITYVIRVTFKDGKTRDIAQSGFSAIDAISLVGMRLHREFAANPIDVTSIALCNF